MTKIKKKAAAKGGAKFADLEAKKNPKGGAIDSYLKLGGQDGYNRLNPQPLPP